MILNNLPIISFYKTNKNIYIQVYSSLRDKVICSVSTLDKSVRFYLKSRFLNLSSCLSVKFLAFFLIKKLFLLRFNSYVFDFRKHRFVGKICIVYNIISFYYKLL